MGACRVSAFYLSMLSSEFVVGLLYPTLFWLMVYFCVGLTLQAANFFITLFTSWLLSFASMVRRTNASEASLVLLCRDTFVQFLVFCMLFAEPGLPDRDPDTRHQERRCHSRYDRQHELHGRYGLVSFDLASHWCGGSGPTSWCGESVPTSWQVGLTPPVGVVNLASLVTVVDPAPPVGVVELVPPVGLTSQLESHGSGHQMNTQTPCVILGP